MRMVRSAAVLILLAITGSIAGVSPVGAQTPEQDRAQALDRAAYWSRVAAALAPPAPVKPETVTVTVERPVEVPGPPVEVIRWDTLWCDPAGACSHVRPAPQPDPPAPPATPPSTVAPLIEERFSYASVAQLLASPLYNRVEDQRTDRMALDTSVRFEGHPTLRYDYPGGRALEYTITRQLRVPAGTREVWVEAFVRFQPGFTFDTGGGMKLLHVNVNPDGVGRFGLNIENGNAGTINAEGPVDNYDAFYLRGPTSSRFRTGGEWYRLRYRVTVANQKSHAFWLGDQFVGQRSATTRANEIWGVSLARNMNRTGDSPMSLWWGEVRIWTTDPGW